MYSPSLVAGAAWQQHAAAKTSANDITADGMFVFMLQANCFDSSSNYTKLKLFAVA